MTNQAKPGILADVMTPEKFDQLARNIGLCDDTIMLLLKTPDDIDNWFIVQEWRLGIKLIPREYSDMLLRLHTLFLEESTKVLQRVRQEDIIHLDYIYYRMDEDFAAHDPQMFAKFAFLPNAYEEYLEYLKGRLVEVGCTCTIRKYWTIEDRKHQEIHGPPLPDPSEPANENLKEYTDEELGYDFSALGEKIGRKRRYLNLYAKLKKLSEKR